MLRICEYVWKRDRQADRQIQYGILCVATWSGQKKASGPQKLELQVSHPIWVLETELLNSDPLPE